MKYIASVILMIITLAGCSQSVSNQFKFGKLIYHSSACMGSCPMLNLEIDSDKVIKVNRQFFTERNIPMKTNSGSFKGILNDEKFNEVLAHLESSNYDSLKFPPVDCCDAPIITIIVYCNDKRTYLKSMEPPANANNFISYLDSLTSEIKLPGTSEENKIEK
jgi:hypothetical protein